MNINIHANIPAGQAAARPTQALSLREGDRFTGEVVRISDGEATLRMQGGGLLRAQVGADVQLTVGQQVQLTVTQVDEQRITMKLDAQQQGGSGALLTVDLPQMTAQQRQAAAIYSLIREYGMTPGKESFAKVGDLMERFPQLDARTAAFIAANLRAGDGAGASVAQLAQVLSRPEAGVGEQLGALIEALSPQAGEPGAAQSPGVAPGDIVGEGQAAGGTADGQGAQALMKFLAGTSPEGMRYIQASGLAEGAAVALRAAAAMPEGPARQLIEAFVLQTASPGVQPPESLLPALYRALEGLAGRAAQGTEGAQAASSAPTGGQDQAAAGAPQAAQQGGQGLPQAAPAQAIPTQTAPTQATAAPATAQGAAQVPPAQAVVPQGQQVVQGAAQTMAQGTAPPVAQGAVQTAPATQAMAQGAAQAGQLVQLADSLFVRAQGDGQQVAADLRRVTETMLQTLSRISEGAAALPGGEAASALAYQAEARAQSLPQILQFHYMQIPVQIRDGRQSADLYVMRRPGRAREEGEECTVLIALETEHIGRVEAVVRAAGSEVSVTFRMRPGGAAQAVKDAFPALFEAVEGAGYRLREAAMAALDEPVTPQTFVGVLEELFASEGALDVLA